MGWFLSSLPSDGPGGDVATERQGGGDEPLRLAAAQHTDFAGGVGGGAHDRRPSCVEIREGGGGDGDQTDELDVGVAAVDGVLAVQEVLVFLIVGQVGDLPDLLFLVAVGERLCPGPADATPSDIGGQRTANEA